MTGLRFDTLLGPLYVAEDGEGICLIEFGGALPEGCAEAETPLLLEARRQLAEYFAGERIRFTLPLSLCGTPFQKRVWQALRDIPFGETRRYGQVAAAVGCPKACRAVGGANHKNPVSIVVPCHRVIGADGSLVGYGGGLDKKKALLKLEASAIKKNGRTPATP